MSTESLFEQIKSINDIMQYIKLVCDETEMINECFSDTLMMLRQKGLRTETADLIQTYMDNVNSKLGDLLSRIQNCDYVYLDNVKRDLEGAINEN